MIQNYRTYLKYVEKYTRREIEVKSKGYQMSSKMLSEKQFYNAYNALRNDRLDEIDLGKRRSLGNLVDGLISEQTYSNSVNYARNITDAYKRMQSLSNKINYPETGLYTKIRYGQTDIKGLDEFWQEVGSINRSLRDQGFSSSQAALYVSQQVFGS